MKDDGRTFVDPADLDLTGLEPTTTAETDPHAPRFRVEDEIARGGLGRVHRGWDAHLEREVAVKALLDERPSARVRFEREMRITARLQHPNIVPVYDGGLDPDGHPYLAMRLVHGQSLGAAIEACDGLAERLTLLPHLVDACNAMAYAHAEGVTHRDLKPDNILVGAYGETVVIDWGLAKDAHAVDEPTFTSESGGAVSGSSASTVTQVGAVVGTPAYMPPEQAAGRRVDQRADVYALGAVLYHLLAGVRPYKGQKNTLDAVLAGPPTPLSAMTPGVPPDLAAVVDKAMQRAVDDRYPDAGALAAELEAFTNGRLVGAYDYTRTERLVRWVRKNPWNAGLGAMLVLTIAAAVASLAGAYQVAEKRADEAELANTALAEARDTERERLDELTLEQAELLMTRDPGRSLELLDSLSRSFPFDGRVRTVASGAWNAQPARPLPFARNLGAVAANDRVAAFTSGSRTTLVDADLRVIRTVDGPNAHQLVDIRDDAALTCGGGRLLVIPFDPEREVTEVGLPTTCKDVRCDEDGCYVAYHEGLQEIRGVTLGPMIDLPGPVRRVARRTGSPGLWVESQRRVLLTVGAQATPVGELPLDRTSDAYALVANPYRDQVALLGDQPSVRLITPTETGLQERRLDLPVGWVAQGTWLDADTLVTGGASAEVFVVDVPTGEHTSIPLRGAPYGILRLDEHTLLVSTDQGQVLRIELDADGTSQLYELGAQDEPIAMAEPAFGDSVILVGTHTATLQKTSPRDGREVFHFEGRVEGLLRRGDQLWIRGAPGAVRLDLVTGDATWLARGRISQMVECGGAIWMGAAGWVGTTGGKRLSVQGEVRALECGEGLLAAATTTGNVHVFDVATSKELDQRVFEADLGLYAVLLEPDGTVWVPARSLWRWRPGNDPERITDLDQFGVGIHRARGSLFVLDPTEMIVGADGPAPEILPLPQATFAFASQGDLILAGDYNGRLYRFHPDGTYELLPGHRQYIHALVPHPTLPRFASTSWDDTAILWDLSTTPAGRPLRGHTDAVLTAAWSEDGTTLYTGDRAGSVRAWSDTLPMDPDALRAEVHRLAESVRQK